MKTIETTALVTPDGELTITLQTPPDVPPGQHRVVVVIDEQPAAGLEPPPANLASTDFWQGATVAELAAAQGVQPVEQLAEVWGDFWPEEESVDDFINTVRQWRREGVA